MYGLERATTNELTTAPWAGHLRPRSVEAAPQWTPEPVATEFAREVGSAALSVLDGVTLVERELTDFLAANLLGSQAVAKHVTVDWALAA